jgi:DNA-directed RNA polymerase subunit RPC12/RpoP
LDLESILAAAILIIVLLMFIFIFAIVALSFIKWFRTPTIKIEDYSCPKCGSKELEVVGRRTLRCKKCGTTFTIQPRARNS